MDDQIAMGNRASVSASEKINGEEEVNSVSSSEPPPPGQPPSVVQPQAPQDDPDFAEELAELAGIGTDDVPEDEFANEQLDEGLSTAEENVRETSEKSKMQMDDVSSEAEGEFNLSQNNENKRRISTESLTSTDDVLLPDKSRPEVSNSIVTTTVVTDAKHTEPLSDTDSSVVDKEEAFGHADGIRIHIRSMEDELDDINSEEEDYNAVKEPKPVEAEVPTVPTEPTSSSDSCEPGTMKESPTRDNSELIQEDIIDIDAILGDLEVLSETSETEDVAELSSVPVPDVPCDLNLQEEIVEKSEKEERKPNQLTCDETMDENQEMAELKPPEAQEEEARTADPLPMEVQSTIEENPPVNSTLPESKSLEKADIVEVIDDSDEEDQQPVNAAKRLDVNPSLLTEMKPPKESDEPVPVIASLPEGNTEIPSTVTDAIKDGELEGELKAIPANILQSILAGLPMETTVTDSEENLEEKEEDNNLISLDDYFSDSMDSHSKPSSMLSEDMVKERASGSDSALTIREDSSSPIREVVVKKMHSGACINPDCLSDEKPTTTTTLLTAPAFARSYYRCEKKNKKKKGRKAKVCEICLDECIAKYKSLWDKFEGQSLDYSDVPLPTDIEIIGSSDEEDEKQTKPPPTVIETKEEADVDKISSDLSQYLEENFESLIAEMQTKFKFQEKVLSFQDSCEKKLREQSKELDKMFSEVNQIMGKTDGMYHQLMDVVLQIHPSLTDMLQPPPDAHHRSLAPGSNCFALWLPGQYRQARVLQWTWDFSQSNPMYEVEFDRHAVVNQTGVQIRVLSSDQLAFDHHQSDWKFHFGARVVALQPREVRAGNSGMVMDLQPNRVLVLFEDSTVKYVDRNMLRLCVTRFPSVRHASIVLDRHSKPMIRELLETATVKEFRFNTGDMVDLYLASKWFVAQVLAVDQAVVLCGIKQKQRVMYAGSPYIRPINNSYILTKSICMDGPNVTVKAEVYVSPYTQQRDQQQQQQLQQNQQQKKKLQLRVQPPRAQSAQQRNFEQRSSSSSSKNINIAYESDQAGRQSRFSVAPPQPPMAQHQQNHQHKTTNHYQHHHQQQQQRYPPQQMELRQVAKKSGSAAGERTSRPRQAVGMPSQYYRHVKNMNNATIYLDEDDDKQGQVVSSVAPKKYSKPFMPHECGPACRPLVSSDLSRYNPLSKPLLSGWKRKILTTNTRAKYITYKAPCGRSLRNMYEVHHYLNVTQSPFNVDLFEFEVEVQCLSEYRVDQKAIKWQSQDLSEGREPMPISCINYYDTTLPPTCVYSTERTPTEGVDLNLDEDFLACCDCEDDCLDKERCQCWQLTIQGERMRDPDIIQDDVGYVYKRLPNPVPTGIYECNPRCRCSKNCLNRVVQHKIQLKLQVYKTANRGWGIRCLNDVPKGGFICVYAGHLLTEQKANEAGENAGDEYFAELDYIEVAERLKQGYESDVPDDWRSDTSTSSSSDSEGNAYAMDTNYRSAKVGWQSQRKRTPRQSSNTQQPKRKKIVPLRKFYGEHEDIYVMDAKITGNIGRYFNHSCAPNLFVQNVFVDTHDLRFPWVSFFALHNIRAGTELTWNYNYEVGSVQGKILICQCGAENCRGRIL